MRGWSWDFRQECDIPDLSANRPKKNTKQASTPCPCPSSCPCPCQLVKVAFMACRCFLYESDRVWERNADQTMWGERKPKGGNLKTTPPSEIFTTAAQGERERERERRKEREEAKQEKKRETDRRGKWRRARETVRGAKMWRKRERSSGVYIY